ncbi:hypothetical protein CEXT_238331 [Caerostris extrusa]|uniref:Uncharacterized protein n=1 Tax=Caerostris extrusa TaxID=172846 RepID=A0AAV4T759_CAEEX|nr:hypothetical protein CEXT_238331 [Caerostris extrusa]
MIEEWILGVGGWVSDRQRYLSACDFGLLMIEEWILGVSGWDSDRQSSLMLVVSLSDRDSKMVLGSSSSRFSKRECCIELFYNDFGLLMIEEWILGVGGWDF